MPNEVYLRWQMKYIFKEMRDIEDEKNEKFLIFGLGIVEVGLSN